MKFLLGRANRVFIASSGQVLYPATQQDVDVLSQSTRNYPAPKDVEGGVIIRLVRLSDPVTSPVARTVRNAQVGIRGAEKWTFLGLGLISVSVVWSFGFWQLERMKWKKALIEQRKQRLYSPRVQVEGSPFPWNGASEEHAGKCVADFTHRVVDVRGVFDHTREQLVGPRAGEDVDGDFPTAALFRRSLF